MRKNRENDEDTEVEQAIRSGRKFNLTEAIGRIGGGGLLKGGSPVPQKRQAEMQIERYLESNLGDSEGALRIVLCRRTKSGDVLGDRNYDRPFEALAVFIGRILSSEELLHDLVNDVDAEWGRIYYERPHFQKDGSPPDQDDPYTFSSVRVTLTRLVEQLRDK